MMRGHTIALLVLLLIPAGGTALAQDAETNALCTGSKRFCSSYGRSLLSYREAKGLRARGYPWNSIYAASIIAARTGEDVDALLREAYVGGRTWGQIAMERNQNWSEIEDSVYDFGPECTARQQVR